MADEVQNKAAGGRWLPGVFKACGVTDEMSAAQILERTDELASAMAPNTRRRGFVLIMVEGLAVILPTVWLLRQPLNIPLPVAAIAGFLSPCLVILCSWWYRFQGVSRVWARARLVAETCRSFLATKNFPTQPAIRMGRVIPALAPLVERLKKEVEEPTGQPEEYVAKRIRDQREHYEKRRDEAEEARLRLTRGSALLMDLGVAVGVSGLVMAVHPQSAAWLNKLGGTWGDLAFGLAGLALPLFLLMVQSLRMMGESTRRTARYQEQIVLLTEIENLLEDGNDLNAQIPEAIRRTEMALLAEVMEWYFQVQASEEFFEIKRDQKGSVHQIRELKFSPVTPRGRWLQFVGTYSGLILQLTIRRLSWAIASAGATILYVTVLLSPTEDFGRLHEAGRLLLPSGGEFEHDLHASSFGTLVVAHGMRDEWHPRGLEGPHWTAAICEGVRERTGLRAPQMMILDWAHLAKPSEAITAPGQLELLQDVVGIRPQAEYVGDYLGLRICQMIERGVIHTNQPLHFVGHSAGGFVVARAALIAHRWKRHPMISVTILDTPKPGDEITRQLPQAGKTYFYKTSKYVELEPENAPDLEFQFVESSMKNWNDQHSYAWQWFQEQVKKRDFEGIPFPPYDQ